MANSPYFHSSAPIIEGWLLKALRLAHSGKSDDMEKLRKLYKDACEDELHVSRITVTDALREPKTRSRSETPERESNTPRIRPALILNDPIHGTTARDNPSVSSMPTSTTTDVPNPTLTTVAATKPVKRTKVAFFNIFDPTSSNTGATPTTLRISNPPLPSRVVSEPASEEAAPAVIDLTGADSNSTVVTPTMGRFASVEPSVKIPLSTPVIDLTAPRETPDAHLVASLVADLACSVCGKLTRPPQLEADGQTMNANMLVECTKCGALYHQMCHEPALSSARPINQQEWKCSRCVPKLVSTSTASGNLGGARKRKGGARGPIFVGGPVKK